MFEVLLLLAGDRKSLRDGNPQNLVSAHSVMECVLLRKKVHALGVPSSVRPKPLFWFRFDTETET